jgi:hypothetical protein
VSVFTTIVLAGDLEEALQGLPPRAGVGQILGPEGRNLVIGRPAHLRRWAANQLGLGKPAPKGKRPPTDLSPIATAVAFAESTSPFHQRLLFERLMERHVAREKRRDLKPIAFLHLDPTERFPRLVVRGAAEELPSSFGPFRDRRAAERVRAALHKVWPLRPCDYAFEPDPQLALGLGCLYAQVRSCAAPCLARVSEAGYRGLAAEVAAVLDGGPRPQELEGVLPPFVANAGARGVVVASNREGGELYPVWGGAVLEESRVSLDREALHPETRALEAALASLRFQTREPPRDDRPWLLAWLAAPRRGGAYLVPPPSHDVSTLAARVREVLS